MVMSSRSGIELSVPYLNGAVGRTYTVAAPHIPPAGTAESESLVAAVVGGGITVRRYNSSIVLI